MALNVLTDSALKLGGRESKLKGLLWISERHSKWQKQKAWIEHYKRQ